MCSRLVVAVHGAASLEPPVCHGSLQDSGTTHRDFCFPSVLITGCRTNENVCSVLCLETLHLMQSIHAVFGLYDEKNTGCAEQRLSG